MFGPIDNTFLFLQNGSDRAKTFQYCNLVKLLECQQQILAHSAYYCRAEERALTSVFRVAWAEARVIQGDFCVVIGPITAHLFGKWRSFCVKKSDGCFLFCHDLPLVQSWKEGGIKRTRALIICQKTSKMHFCGKSSTTCRHKPILPKATTYNQNLLSISRQTPSAANL